MQPGMTPTVRAEMTSADNAETSMELACRIMADLRSRLGEKRFALWFDGKIRLSIADDCLTVSVGSPFLQNWMQRQFRTEIAAAAHAVLGHSAQVKFDVDATSNPTPSTNQTAAAADSLEKLPVELIADKVAKTQAASVESQHTETVITPATRVVTGPSVSSSPSRRRRLADLAEFIGGPQTDLALAAARQFAGGQHIAYNSLYLCGPIGTGKTHLLEGICRHLKSVQPSANVVLITAEAFGNYFTQALRDHSLPSFRQRFRTVDALLIDNVDFFESKRAFQEEFLHTFMDLIDHSRPVVLSGTRHPRLLTKLSDDLVSRFQSGLVCRLEAPDLETRKKIVLAKAGRMTGEFALEALEYIAQRFQGSVRELEGALNCLQANYVLTRKRITLSAARDVLGDLERDCLKMIRLADVERVICNLFGIRPKDLQSESRVRTISQPRMLAMFLARKHTPSAYTEIGEHFGGRNHSTVISAERKVLQWLEKNETLKVASQNLSIGEILQSLEQQLLAG